MSGRAPCSQVYRDDRFMAFMDIHPWSPGHTLVVPLEHQQHVSGLGPDTRAQLFELATRISDAIRSSELCCDDLHFLLNDGRAANQTVPHVHMHVLPRCRGDTRRRLLALGLRPVLTRLAPTARLILDQQAAAIRAHLPLSPASTL